MIYGRDTTLYCGKGGSENISGVIGFDLSSRAGTAVRFRTPPPIWIARHRVVTYTEASANRRVACAIAQKGEQ